MNIMTKLLAAITTVATACSLWIAAAAHASQQAGIPFFTAHYELLRNDSMKLGEVKRTTTSIGDGTIAFESYSKTTGLAALFIKDTITERTTFTVDNSVIQPHDYLYDRKGGKRSRETRINFDWTEKSVSNPIDQRRWEVELPDGTQDKLSYQLQLMLDLQAGNTDFNYPVADDDRLKEYRFTLLGEETIDTPMGKIETVKIKRERAADSKRKTTIWFAKSLRYLPVRIKQGKSEDKFITLEITAVEGIRPFISDDI